MDKPYISDCHIHMGFYTDNKLLLSPVELANHASSLNIRKFSVSSISMLSKNYKVVNDEISILRSLCPDKVMPLLWARPFMLNCNSNIFQYFNYPIYGFKIHGYHDNWIMNGKQINRLFSIANEMSLSILVHTGYKEAGPVAMSFKKVAERYPFVKIVLAHGRPENQTLFMVKNFTNVYVDTAYTTDECIDSIYIQCGASKIVFGSDFPIDKLYFPNDNIEELYKKKIEKYILKYGQDIFEKWTQTNFNHIFNPQRYNA